VIAGHFGFAAAVKARAPSVPLWPLMLACVWLDIVFIPLLVAGIETLVPTGTPGAYGQAIIHADYTHSLVGALALSALFGGLGALRWGARAGVILGAVAFSHWPLDLLCHHHDMPLLPGQPGFLGFGLWSFPALSAAIELAIVLAGAFLYWRAATRVAGPRAKLPAAVLLASGLLTLGLNVLGM